MAFLQKPVLSLSCSRMSYIKYGTLFIDRRWFLSGASAIQLTSTDVMFVRPVFNIVPSSIHPCHSPDDLTPASQRWGPNSTSAQFTWDLWRKKWRRNMFLSENVSYPSPPMLQWLFHSSITDPTYVGGLKISLPRPKMTILSARFFFPK